MSPRAAWRLESLGFTEVYDYEGGKLDWMAFSLPIEGREARTPKASDVVRRDAPTCLLGDRAADVLARMAEGGWSWAAVLNHAGIVLGRLRRQHVDRGPGDARVEELMEEGPSTYRPDIPCQEIVDKMREVGFDRAFITDSDGRWIGLLTRQDAHAALTT